MVKMLMKCEEEEEEDGDDDVDDDDDDDVDDYDSDDDDEEEEEEENGDCHDYDVDDFVTTETKMLRNEDGQLTFKPGESRTAQQSSSMILRQVDVQRYRGIDPEEITKEDIHRGVGDGLGHSQKFVDG
ncbi:hypothetical protein ACROYT_G023257 [Oculina patagonica]